MKLEQQQHKIKDISRNSLLWFILASMLVHGLVLLVYGRLRRSPPSSKQKQENQPIEFIVVPPEESPEEPPPETQRKAVNNSVAEKAVEPEKAIADPKAGQKPAAPSAPAIAPQPPATPPKEQIAAKPQPIEPPSQPSQPTSTPPEKKLPVLSGSDNTNIAKPQPNPVKEPKQPTAIKPTEPNETSSQSDEPVATSLPSAIKPTPPATKPESTSGAASLLGGDYQRSLDRGDGDAFFSPEALAYKTVLNPSQLNALKDLDLGPYFAEIRRRVKSNWNPSYAAEDYTTFLTFSIQKDGQVTDLKVERSSGSAAIDRESIAAVQKSAPFAPLPPNFPLPALEVEFTFNVYIY